MKALVRNLCITLYYMYVLLYIYINRIGSSFLTMSCSILLMADAIPGTLTFGKSSFSFNPKDTTEVSNYVRCAIEYV